MLNIPMLKGHKRAGMTMFAKNHFGSSSRRSATHVHGGLVAPNEENPPTRPGYGLYRVQVDLLGHELLGKKNLFYLMDALWATDYELDQPLKWMMAPFNNDWMSSVFASFDPLAIESVGYDFLRTEFTTARGVGTYVQMYGTDDYLHQAADTTRWAAGIRYDPENDGTVLGSLGVHEHWNDGMRKQYTRNLSVGNGIELLQMNRPTAVEEGHQTSPRDFVLFQNYPNPFSARGGSAFGGNPTTTIAYSLPSPSSDGDERNVGTVWSYVTLKVYDVLGSEVATLVNEARQPGTYTVQWDASGMSSGVYFCRLAAGEFVQTRKFILLR
jgi:hypothetical protein